jgi:hypothetical protein
VWCDQAAGFAQYVGVVAGPAVVFGLVDHARTHGVEFDVAVAGEYIVFALREAGAEPAFPQYAATFVGAVDVLHVALTEMFHQQGGAVGFLRGKQEIVVCPLLRNPLPPTSRRRSATKLRKVRPWRRFVKRKQKQPGNEQDSLYPAKFSALDLSDVIEWDAYRLILA